MTQSLLQNKRYFCREWAFAKIAHCLENRPSSKTCGALIMGGPGCGKTSLCCEIIWPTVPHGKQVTLSNRVLAYHFCQAHDIETLSFSNFIGSLVQQIRTSELLTGDYSEKIKDPEIAVALESEECEHNPDEAFKKGIVFPLLEIDAPKQTCFLLIDSIDESFLLTSNEKNASSQTIAELLSNHHHLFPHWLLLVCSARKQSKSVTRLFTGFRKVSLDDLRKSHVVRDVQQYILSRLDQEQTLRQHLSKETAEMLNQLHIKSNGCFLYLEKVLDGVAENFIMLREIREIPGTLNGLYLWLCQRLFVRKQFLKVQPILNVILAARKPLTQEQLYQCVWTRHNNMTREEFSKRFFCLSKLLIDGKNCTKILFHHSFAEWLLDVKHCTQKYLCNAGDGHSMLAMRHTLFASLLNEDEVHDFALHLSKIPITDSMEQFHLPLWLILSNAPLEGILFKKSQNKDQKIAKLLVSAGVGALETHECCIHAETKLPDDPLDTLLASGDLNQVDGNQRTLLHSACYEGNEQLVERLISHGALLEAVDKNGQTALNLASRQGHARVVELLLAAGSNPDHADNDGWTPLRSSAWAGHTEVVNALLLTSAEVNLADSDHRTALRAASWGGHEEIVLKLLQHGACVNKEDNEGRTALIAAAYMGHTEIVEHLLNHGAEINHEDADSRTALSVAALCIPASEGHAGVVSLLLERGAEVDHRDKDGMTPLLVAAFEGHSEVCELLLEGDADVDHVDNNSRTPLFAAASMGHPSVVNLLLFWGAAIDTIDSEGRTVLSIAASQGNMEVVRQLLDRGLDEMHRDNAGWTPLHYAAFEGNVEVSELLIDAGSRMSEIDNDGRIPLILAAQEGHMALVDRLLTYSKSMIDHRAHDGRTALRISALEGHKETVHLFIQHGADLNYVDADGRSTLYILALENHLEMVEFLLINGANVDATDLEGRTSLHVSSWQGHYEMVELLLNFGAKVNAVDNDQRTALQSASWQGHAPIVRLLLERKAHVDHTCNQGATALCIAAQEGHEDVVQVLLEYGADPNHADQFGRNPLRVALKGGHHSVIRLLEEYTLPPVDMTVKHHQCAGSTSTTSLTSASTAETKPCSAILCQPGVGIMAVVEHGGVDKRRSFISNNSSSRSSSNLTTSTNKSVQQVTEIINHRPLPPTSSAVGNGGIGMTFTQQLQQCTRNRNRVSRILSPLTEPQSAIPSPPQSPLSEVQSPQGGSPFAMQVLGSFVQDGYIINENKNPVPGLYRLGSAVDSSRRTTHLKTDSQNVRPPESRARRNGIVTNPNYKGKSNLAKEGTGGSKHIGTVYEDIRPMQIKKETPL